jgi:alpha-tubulin suppressor-like RCC1 family protein
VLADGTVRAWGANTYGQLGDGTTTRRTSPVTVPNLTGVELVTAGRAYSAAL